MQQVIFILFLYRFKINMVLKITIKFMINYY